MAIEYRLILAGDSPVEQIAVRALPEAEERPTGTPPLLSAALWERYGFLVTIRAGRNGYVDVESEAGSWLWEPAVYVSVSFRLDKFVDREWAVTNMAMIVRRVLGSGPEDAAFSFNGDDLLLNRLDGELVKHNRDSWWNSHPAADQLIAG